MAIVENRSIDIQGTTVDFKRRSDGSFSYAFELNGKRQAHMLPAAKANGMQFSDYVAFYTEELREYIGNVMRVGA